MKNLINKSIKNIFIDNEYQLILFIIEDYKSCRRSSILYKTTAECCSSTYIYEITNPEVVLPSAKDFKTFREEYEDVTKHQILAIDEKQLPSLKNTENDKLDEHIDPFGYTLITRSGYCDIIFRNFSNGYYSGNIEVVDIFDITDEEWINKYSPFLRSCEAKNDGIAIEITKDWIGK